MVVMHSVRAAWPYVTSNVTLFSENEKIYFDSMQICFGGICFLGFSWLSDKYNPKKVSIIGLVVLGSIVSFTGFLIDI